MSFLDPAGWVGLANFMFVAGFAVLQVLHLTMISEINSRLPTDRHVKYGQWAAGDTSLCDLHKQLFPESKLSLAIKATMLLWCPFVVIAVWRFREALLAW